MRTFRAILSTLVVLLSATTAFGQAELPDAPTPAKQRTALLQPGYCDMNSMVPVCPGFIRTSAKPPGSIQGLKKRLILKDGTRIRLRFKTSLDSKQVKAGDPVELEVFEDVRVEDALIVSHSARAWATADLGTHKPTNVGVDFARFIWTGTSNGNGGKIVLELNGLWAVTGETIPLRGHAWKQGDDGYIPAEGGLFVIPLMFLANGEQARIPRGTKIDAFVDGDISLDADLVRGIVTYTDHDKELNQVASRGKAWIHIYRPKSVAACAATEPSPYSPVPMQNGFAQKIPESGDLYCYEPGLSDVGRPRVFLDGQEIARIGPGRFISFELEPGRHILRADDNEVDLTTNLGSEHYLRLFVRGALKGKGRLQATGALEAEDAMFTMQPVDPKRVTLISSNGGAQEIRQ